MPRRRGAVARARASTSRAASCRCSRSGSRTASARSIPRVDRLVLSAILETRPEGPCRRLRVRQGRHPQRPPDDLHGGRAAARDGRPPPTDEERYGPCLADFRVMGELAALLRERREARGSIDFDLPDADIVLDDAGLVVGIVPESRNVAHRLIEEFMLAANEAVAKKLLFAKQPAIYRVHDRPDPDRLVDLREVLESFGYELKGDLEEVPPSAFQTAPEGDRGQARGAAASRPAPAGAAQGGLQPRSAAGTTRSPRRTTATSPRRSGGIPDLDRAPPALAAARGRAGPSRRRTSRPSTTACARSRPSPRSASGAPSRPSARACSGRRSSS